MPFKREEARGKEPLVSRNKTVRKGRQKSSLFLLAHLGILIPMHGELDHTGVRGLEVLDLRTVQVL